MQIIRKEYLTKSYERWDLEVEDTHNFVVEHCVVHNSHCAFGLVGGEFVVSSRNIPLKESDTNIYWKVARKYDIETKLRSVTGRVQWSIPREGSDLWIHGEIFGPIQDLNYGEKEATLAIFDARTVYENNENIWWDYDPLKDLCKRLDLRMVPELYRGPCNILTIKCHSEGQETWSGRSLHIREGCVIKPVIERRSARGDRVLLKIINPAYLLRKGGTELH